MNIQGACDELDHTDMVALSGMFRRWAIHEDESRITPEQRTRMIQLSADYERIAEWVGPSWRASDPSPKPPLLKFIATLERKSDNVTDFVEAAQPRIQLVVSGGKPAIWHRSLRLGQASPYWIEGRWVGPMLPIDRMCFDHVLPT